VGDGLQEGEPGAGPDNLTLDKFDSSVRHWIEYHEFSPA
jgi:hypothetical protein